MESASLDYVKWLTNLRNIVEVIGAFGGIFFGALAAIAKFCDENKQIWPRAPSTRQKLLWRARSRFRLAFRRLYYSQFHDIFFRALDDSRVFLMRTYLAPAEIFRGGQSLNFPIIVLLPLALVFSWAYYIQLDAFLNTPDMLIPALKELENGSGALIEHNADGSWSGRLVTLVALPMFTLLPIAFSVAWGWGVILIWHSAIHRLPESMWSKYAPFSAAPFLLVLSIALTGIALIIGKFTSPTAPMPSSPRVFIVNSVFDIVSVTAAWLILRQTLPLPTLKDRVLSRFVTALGRLCSVIFVTAVFAVMSLYISLHGTVNEISFRVALNTLIARPTSEESLFPRLKDIESTVLNKMIDDEIKTIDTNSFDYTKSVMLGYLIAYDTGSFRLLDVLEQKIGKKFTPEAKRQFQGFKEVAAIRFYGRSGYGPYFWLEHTTMFPLLVVSSTLLIYSISMLMRLLAAAWMKRVSIADKPYNYIATCAAICGTCCGVLAYICK